MIRPYFFFLFTRSGSKNTWLQFGKDLMTISVFKITDKVVHFADVSREFSGKLTKGLLNTPALQRCATGKAQQVCSIISTTPGGIKVLKGAGLIRVKERSVLFSIYIYIYTSIYIFIYLYTFLYIYCRKKNGMFSRFFAKVRNVLAFFSVLCKRMFRSFPFFAKE